MEQVSYSEPQSRKSGFAPRRHYDNISTGPEVKLSNGQTAAVLSETPKIQVISFNSKPKNEIILNASVTMATPFNTRLTIEETLKLTDANGLAMKTPVSILQELLSRRGITPSYELVQIEGAIHEPTFRYRVSFSDKEVPFTAMGAGRSKKEAKHAAARALIDKLVFAQSLDSSEVGASAALKPAPALPDANENLVGSGEGADNIVGNPIGWLQEMCMSRRWPPPSYHTETEVGLPHERLFTIACSILNFREVGKGKSKKIAKRLAAHKMWLRLEDNTIDNVQINESIKDELEGQIHSCSDYYNDLKDFPINTLTSQHSTKVSQFHKALKNSTGKKLIKLQKTCLSNPKLDYIKLLSEIANENQFEVTYVDIEERTLSNLYQCLVQLSTLPVGVCHGSGITAADAQIQAAENALEYLKIMTKK